MSADAPADGRSTVVIQPRFNGPPGSANGGYTCGVAATALGPGPAVATLRRPPPIDTPLELVLNDGAAVLEDADGVIAEARAGEFDLELPSPVSWAEATHAAERFDLVAYEARHAFPGCFTCGPHRGAGDGLRLFPGRVRGRRALVAWPLTVDESVLGADRLMDTRVLWAALDCPSAWAWIADTSDETLVLGRLAADIGCRPGAGERLVVGAWKLAREGRRRMAATAIWAEDGALVANALATWVALTEEQRARFGAAR